jgi:predicted TIM-barrel fold metal-dependent hydrolase
MDEEGGGAEMTHEEYKQNLVEYFDSLLPPRVYDAHFHLATHYKKRPTCIGEPVEEYLSSMAAAIPRPVAGGLLMPSPSSRHTAETLAVENDYVIKVAEEHGFKVGYIVTPTMQTPEEVDAYIEAHKDTIRALKPYLCYSTGEDNFESDLGEYVPDWMFEIANERELPVIIHLSHYTDMLLDPNNIRDIRAASRRFPRAKIVLAHCALGHHVRKLRLALPEIADLDNVYFDCSGVAETMSIYYCLKTFGPSRMMWGGDFAYGAGLGRCISFGSNFLGLHPGYLKEPLPRDYKYEPLDNTTEGTVATLEACEVLGYGKDELEAIFYSNGKAFYG